MADGADKISIANDVSIKAYCWLNCRDDLKKSITLKIGDGCSIGRFAHINAYGSVVLEDHVLLAERVHISDCVHSFADSDRPIISQGDPYLAPVIIKRGAWIGVGAVILPGVTIGRNAIVGANTVVRKNTVVPDYHLAVGNPARIIPQRSVALT